MAVHLAASLAVCPRSARAQQGSAALELTVRTKDGQIPLQSARLSLQPAGRQGLSDENGQLRFAGLAAGSYQLRIQRIGYTPFDTVVALGDGERRLVDILLVHVAVQLVGVRVTAYPPCKKPGVPKPEADLTLSTLLEQLRLNGEQYRYLVDSMPFVYLVERTSGNVYGSGATRTVLVDSAYVGSAKDWKYRAGRIVTSVPGLLGGRENAMNLPMLDDFASKEFLTNHCFHYAGLERKDTVTLVRIDFRAADRLRSPDVHGTIWLDSTTFSIRRADLELSRLPRTLRSVTGVQVTTYFTEVLKAVPIMSLVDGVTSIDDRRAADPVVEQTEHHRFLAMYADTTKRRTRR
ncbi:MAG: carboxypeptidase-like regulatory domain-containing protein [Gemmatimonadaceae bacterium]